MEPLRLNNIFFFNAGGDNIAPPFLFSESETNMKFISTSTLLVTASILLAAIPSSVFAADGAALYKAKTCIACHGADAQTPIMPTYPKLAGQSAGYALQQMKDIKSGARNNGMTAAMKGVMHLVSDEEMAALADYLESL